MSVERIDKGFRIRFRPFGEKQVNLVVSARNQWEATKVEKDITLACRAGDYTGLSLVEREACIRMFHHQGWKLPPELDETQQPLEELTLWRAVELFVNYPGIKDSKNLPRAIQGLANVVDVLGRERPVKGVWVPELRMYQAKRVAQGAANGTVNRELASLSKLFSVMVELQLIEVNPVRLVTRLSRKQGEREVYLSYQDVSKIAAQCPEWYQAFMWTGYYTGMRRGEIAGLIWRQVNLQRRIIHLSGLETKEQSRKRVPIHRDLAPILEELSKVRSLRDDRLFHLDGQKLGKDTVKNPWPRAMRKLQWADPRPRFHDLRHSWKVNALNSGVDYEVREAILGHQTKTKTVSERYGFLSDAALLDAIDKMTFDHGETHIWVARQKASAKVNSNAM